MQQLVSMASILEAEWLIDPWYGDGVCLGLLGFDQVNPGGLLGFADGCISRPRVCQMNRYTVCARRNLIVRDYLPTP